MANVPMTTQQLEEITIQVAQELLEDWAINDRFEEEHVEKATKDAVSDTVLVINSFMEKFNQVMMESSQGSEQKKLIL